MDSWGPKGHSAPNGSKFCYATQVNEWKIKCEAGAQSSKLLLTPWKARPACFCIHLIARAESRS
jgi:hypothetical protein